MNYRITVDKLDKLDALAAGEGGLESISFFASTPNDLFAEASQLRHRLGCSACTATKLAVGHGLIREITAIQPLPSFVIPTEA